MRSLGMGSACLGSVYGNVTRQPLFQHLQLLFFFLLLTKKIPNIKSSTHTTQTHTHTQTSRHAQQVTLLRTRKLSSSYLTEAVLLAPSALGDR